VAFNRKGAVVVSRRRPLPLLSVVALLVALALPAASQAQNKRKPPPPPPPQKQGRAPSIAPGTLQFQEATALRQAFVLLAAGNHDYGGHRWKAMKAVKAALLPLDDFVLKHGTAEMKAATALGKEAVASAEAAASKAPKVHEPPPASDALLRQAAQLLGQVRPTLVANQQQHVLNHVNRAIGEIKAALKVN
jgi:hypothetical protein